MTAELREGRPKVAIAGASGFVGTALRKELQRDFDLVGLSRRAREEEGIEWRACDLFSLLDVEQALEGCDYAIYLVHSMLPSARMTQASFDDLDLVLADNFARAAAQHGVKQILYLGGLFPDGHATPGELSPHLASRREVEETLRAYGTPVTSLRAGLVVGAGGSSLHILTKLVERLPLMLTPKWTRSPTQPVALRDVVRAFRRCLGDPAMVGDFDIGGPDVMSYREMMQRTAQVLGVRRRMFNVPLFTPGLSSLWVSLITRTPTALVGPLVQSLKHEMTVDDNPLQRWLLKDALGFEDALRIALAKEDVPRPMLASLPSLRRKARVASTVRSVQRLPRPPGASARWIAEEYVRWLPTMPLPGLRCERDGFRVDFHLGPAKRPLLVLHLSDERSPLGRALFYIEGGSLARTDGPRPGRFEFRITPDGHGVIAAIHDFRPALPWYVYENTQAIAHLAVMKLFGRHLRRHPGPRASSVPPPRAEPTRPAR